MYKYRSRQEAGGLRSTDVIWCNVIIPNLFGGLGYSEVDRTTWEYLPHSKLLLLKLSHATYFVKFSTEKLIICITVYHLIYTT